jgi:hypothetical protein
MNKLQQSPYIGFFTKILFSALLFICQYAQAQITQSQIGELRSREGSGVVGLTGPGGGVIIGSNVWVADGRLGFVRMEPIDPLNPNGMLRPSTESIPVSVGGQVCTDGDRHIYVMDASN